MLAGGSAQCHLLWDSAFVVVRAPSSARPPRTLSPMESRLEVTPGRPTRALPRGDPGGPGVRPTRKVSGIGLRGCAPEEACYCDTVNSTPVWVASPLYTA